LPLGAFFAAVSMTGFMALLNMLFSFKPALPSTPPLV
jgi:hypothetical protein